MFRASDHVVAPLLGARAVSVGTRGRPQAVVAGVAFDVITMADTITQILQLVAKAGPPAHICTGNLDHLALMQHHPRGGELRQAYQTADLVLADGMPVVWLSRRGKPLSHHLPERVTGSDLLWELASASARTGLRLFLMGGTPGAAQETADALKTRFPGAVICGVSCPPVDQFDTEAEQARLRQCIRDARPDVLLVGLGAPKQERWIVANKGMLGVPVSIGIGGSFEMASGRVKRAPRWVREAGMEWLWRLCQEPGRLCERYLARDLPFLMGLVVRRLIVERVRTRITPLLRRATFLF